MFVKDVGSGVQWANWPSFLVSQLKVKSGDAGEIFLLFLRGKHNLILAEGPRPYLDPTCTRV